jgi:hypothetical protein
MVADKKYNDLPNHFWASVKLLSEGLGYSEPRQDKLKEYSKDEITQEFIKNKLDLSYLSEQINGNKCLDMLTEYLNYRSRLLNVVVRNNLMKREEAKSEFDKLVANFKPTCKLPMNKQKNDKKHYAYLTCLVNVLTEKELEGCFFVQDPQNLVVVTRNNKPVRTLTRRFDGAYPDIVNPRAIWEIKEYYGTTTFGSRVADAIYETILDGEEIEDLHKTEKIDIRHYLVVDDYFTWWIKGKSYLCRLIDILNMGFLDEVVFGKEVVERWPKIVRSWKE